MTTVLRTRLNDVIGTFPTKRSLVIGDLIADKFIYGQCTRVSREAPVLILKYLREDLLLGGAGNTVNNLHQLGANTIPLGVIGQDHTGKTLLNMMKSMGISSEAVIIDNSRETTEKMRILGSNYHTTFNQKIRIDKEQTDVYPRKIETQLVNTFMRMYPLVDFVAISDYGLGVLSPKLIELINETAKKHEKPFFVDSRYNLFSYRHMETITPNEPEVEYQTGIRLDGAELSLKQAAQSLKDKLKCQAVLITRGRKGMAIFPPEGSEHYIPVHGKDEVADVTGAGDTVLALFSLSRACGADFLESTLLANIAGGIVVMKNGTATVTREELHRELDNWFLKNSEKKDSNP